MQRKIRPNFFGRIVLLYKVSNYLLSLITACGAIHRGMRADFKTVLHCTFLRNYLFLYWKGVVPKDFLNSVIKREGSFQPLSAAALETGYPCSSRAAAWASRFCRRYSEGVTPKWVRNCRSSVLTLMKLERASSSIRSGAVN